MNGFERAYEEAQETITRLEEKIEKLKSHHKPEEKSTKGKDLAWDIATRLRGNEFKDMTLGEIDDFRAEMAKFLDLKKEW